MIHRIMIRLPESAIEALEQRAKAAGKPLASYAAEVLGAHVGIAVESRPAGIGSLDDAERKRIMKLVRSKRKKPRKRKKSSVRKAS